MLWRRGCRRRIRTAIDRFKVCRPTCLDDPAIGWVDSAGIAPATCALGVRCSGLLSYESGKVAPPERFSRSSPSFEARGSIIKLGRRQTTVGPSGLAPD
jgi:hypothetical protein